jgi:hypothetical protein
LVGKGAGNMGSAAPAPRRPRKLRREVIELSGQ